MFEKIINSPAFIVSIISSLIGFIAITIQSLIFWYKNNTEDNNNFKNSVKEKLENIYTPLILKFHFNKKDYLIDDDIIDLLSTYGYLLSKNLLNDFIKLHQLEENLKTLHSIDSLKEKHQNLKSKLIDNLNSEYSLLQNLFTKSYEKQVKKNNLKLTEKIGDIVVNLSVYVTVSFWAIFILITMTQQILEPITQDDSPITIGKYFLSLVIGLTTLFLILFVVLYKVIQVYNFILKKRNISKYSLDDYVPQDGTYKCSFCKKEHWLKQYTKFPICSKKFLHKIYYIAFKEFRTWSYSGNKPHK